MKNDVLIEVENTQTLGGRDEKYTVSVNGTLEYGDGRYTLAYTEYDGELKGCKTLVTVEGGDSVSVAREGGYSTELKLKNGERRTSVYSTPYGEFSLGLFTNRVFTDMSENGGTLETEYTLEFAPDSRALNSMKITVSEGKIEDV